MTFPKRLAAALTDLEEALRLASTPKQRLVRFALTRVRQVYQAEVDRLTNELERVRFRDRQTLPPAGPDLAPVLQASLDRLKGRTGT